MKNSNLFIELTCLIPALLLAGMVNLKAQTAIIGYTYLGTLNGHSYYMSDCPTAWYDALFAAEEMGGYLATITSQEEDEFLAPFAPYIDCESILNGGHRIGGAWIGLLTNDNDQTGTCLMYSWINGEEIGYTNWSQDYFEPISGYCGPAGIIGYIGGNNAGYCYPNDYRWFTNYYTNATSRYIVEFDQDPSCSNPNKTYVCHNGNTICVSVSSLQSHLDHGCLQGPCGPCNTNAMQASPGEIEASEGHSQHTLNKTLSEKHEDHDHVQGRLLSNQIQIYPNPASEEIHVILPEAVQEGTLRILSLTGQEMHRYPFSNQESIELDFSAVAAGIYLIDVQSANGHYQKKIVKL